MNTTVFRENNNATINIRIPNIRYRSHFFVGRKTHPGQDVWPLLCFKSGFVGTSNSIGRNRLTRFSLLTLSSTLYPLHQSLTLIHIYDVFLYVFFFFFFLREPKNILCHRSRVGEPAPYNTTVI